MALFGGAPPAPPAESRPALADDVPEMRGAFRPPGIVASRPPVADLPAPPPVQRAAPAAEASSADAQALWAAFSEAAGLHLQPPQGLNPALMRVIGTLLRTSIEGTLQLISVRAATRVELRAQVTMIQARNNNPLKFSPDAQSALEQMLQPPMRGFLSGPAAMTESMNDLVGHSIGTMAGTRAALEGVLDRFAPKELEAKLAGKSVLDSVLPMARKARLWELYLQHFEAIRNEAQEDFQTLFGKAFLAAYEQQLDRLHHDKKPSSGA
jgi:FHA domain-containing protein